MSKKVSLSPAEREELLVRCFSSVLPALTIEEIRTASSDVPGIWDSLATVTLIAVVEEEFGIQIDQERVLELHSFAAWLNYIQEEVTREA
jgi:acyl carrier protein